MCIGSLHAADAEAALQNARDVYTRRGEGPVCLGGAEQRDPRLRAGRHLRYVDANEKTYRLATYDIPDEVGHM